MIDSNSFDLGETRRHGGEVPTDHHRFAIQGVERCRAAALATGEHSLLRSKMLNPSRPRPRHSAAKVGAREFCWLAPGEFSRALEEEGMSGFNAHGSFVYRFESKVMIGLNNSAEHQVRTVVWVFCVTLNSMNVLGGRCFACVRDIWQYSM